MYHFRLLGDMSGIVLLLCEKGPSFSKRGARFIFVGQVKVIIETWKVAPSRPFRSCCSFKIIPLGEIMQRCHLYTFCETRQDNGVCWQDLRRRIESEVTPHYYSMCRRRFIRHCPLVSGHGRRGAEQLPPDVLLLRRHQDGRLGHGHRGGQRWRQSGRGS